MRAVVWLVAGAAVVAALSACDPFGLPATRALEAGAKSMLTSSRSFEVAGVYSASGGDWKVDMQLERPDARHIVITHQGVTLEAAIIGAEAYFRGPDFLAQHLAGNPLGSTLVKATGNAWWKDSATLVPSLPNFTDGAEFASTFLGSAVTRRTDHQTVAGTDAVELSGARADVFIASAPPFSLLRVHLNKGVVVDGIIDADLQYSHVGTEFKIAAPVDVIDFGNFSTLPPIYTVVSVDTSACGSTCIVSARLRNLGGMTRAQAPSTVTFTLSDAGSGQKLGSCQTTVQPDVGYNSTTTVSCTIGVPATNAAVVTATAVNPGRGSSAP